MSENKALRFKVKYMELGDWDVMESPFLFVESSSEEEALQVFEAWAKENKIEYAKDSVRVEYAATDFMKNTDKHKQYLYTNKCLRAEKGIKKDKDRAEKKKAKHEKTQKWLAKQWEKKKKEGKELNGTI